MESVVRPCPSARYFPEGTVTDYPESLVLAEYVRGEGAGVLRRRYRTRSPSRSDDVDEKKRYGRLRNHPRQRATQRMIVLGKGGRTISQIGTEARRDVERLLGTRIYLDLKVKVSPGWRVTRSFSSG